MKKYVLVEFPYPSGTGLHIGHAFSYTAADVYARYLRMKGNEVLFPMGWDAFGLPTENYAIKNGIKPQLATKRNTDMYREQMDRLGLSFDWDREINTTDPNYYRWTQWIFIKLFEKGLAFKQQMPINWCPKCKVGLANEEVVDDKHERCGTVVERRNIDQWVVKITDYAERLIDGLKNTDFIEKVKAAQINWIGKKEGVLIDFEIKDFDKSVRVFTTRPDTIGGVEFLVIAPEHPLVKELTSKDVSSYLESVKMKSDLERTDLAKSKTGVKTNMVAVNPVTKKEMPVYIADYVLMSYGTGAVMGVPSHDDRDREFAVAMGIVYDENFQPMMQNVGLRHTTYHLRDWIFSRQHYWGEPIPMVKCEKDGWVSLPEEQLPLRLPEVEKYQPTDTGESPLAAIESFVNTTCPKCGGPAKRETDTMPNWAGSDWYFLRYLDPKNERAMAEMELMRKWMPVDVYIGGDEHNTLHLLYSRFIYQFLWDLGAVPKEIPEPYQKRISHGVILGPDGFRMSKSRGNVIVPDEMVAKYGADVLRMYLMFMGPFDATMVWSEKTLMGVKRFVKRFNGYLDEQLAKKAAVSGKRAQIILNKLIKNTESDYATFKFNTVVAKLMEALNDLQACGEDLSEADCERLVAVIKPMAPFLASARKMGEEWPVYEESLTKDEKITLAIQVNGKLRGNLEITAAEASKEKAIVEKAVVAVAKYVQGGYKRLVVIPGRLVNFVV